MVRASTPTAGNGGFVEVGHYHGIVDSYEVCSYKDDKTGETHYGLSLEVSILNGDVDDQVGKSMKYQNFYHGRLYDLAAALMLTDKTTGVRFDHQQREKLRADVEAKLEVRNDYDFDETEVVGQDFCFDVVMGKPKKSGKNAGKAFPEIGKIILNKFHSDAAGIPKDERYLQTEEEAGAGAANSGGSKFD